MYSDVGGLNKQIDELVEAVMLSINNAKKFKVLIFKPPKGVLMYGPHICVADRCMLSEACRAATREDVYRVKMVPDAFELAKKSPVIIFINELDAIGATDKSGDREVQRTMLELLTSPMASSLAIMSALRSSLPQAESTSSTWCSFGLDIWTGRSNQLFLMSVRGAIS